MGSVRSHCVSVREVYSTTRLIAEPFLTWALLKIKSLWFVKNSQIAKSQATNQYIAFSESLL